MKHRRLLVQLRLALIERVAIPGEVWLSAIRPGHPATELCNSDGDFDCSGDASFGSPQGCRYDDVIRRARAKAEVVEGLKRTPACRMMIGRS
ncbi:uncharacterized protein J3R85_013684 [Psidium guajava]|nr:uncharacterized protein J3R85_013684 [Psidium guajava]